MPRKRKSVSYIAWHNELWRAEVSSFRRFGRPEEPEGTQRVGPITQNARDVDATVLPAASLTFTANVAS